MVNVTKRGAYGCNALIGLIKSDDILMWADLCIYYKGNANAWFPVQQCIVWGGAAAMFGNVEGEFING